ncbi:EAL domain-containing protein [Bacillus sp. 31A1R]|uniref:EAL domain-containing protein n=1 Tax=Robertmurraya mangrovi TaxID=3098077 RepID=A0ABU5IYF1_9BACI|nr:EAL domain-containing protein [Bacillus sp. 31A1R]MDZ5472200.1 EAL domain-containing protein [Bacillus sp. 31A1R]
MSGLAKLDNTIIILESKQKCRELGLNPTDIPSPLFIDEDTLKEVQSEYSEILEVVNFFVLKFFDMLQGTPILFVVSDDQGTILEVQGDLTIKKMIEQLGFKPGVIFRESHNGTNAINLALEKKQPVQLLGDQHYHHFLHQSACYTVPINCVSHTEKTGTISIMTLIEYSSPLLLTMLTTVVDSIERELITRHQNRELNIFNQIMSDSTGTGFIMTDKQGYIKEFSKFAEKLTGMSKESTLGRPVEDIKPIGKCLKEVLDSNQFFSDIDLPIINKITSKKTMCLFDGMPIYDERGELIGAFGKFKDITERYEAEEKINYLAYHDDLTGLPNRRAFQQRLTKELEEAIRNKSMLALFVLDLDRFKLINDTLGHDKGDLLLIEVANKIKNHLNHKASLFRMGGDEFTIILTNVHHQQEVNDLGKSLIELFKDPFTIKDIEFHVSTSIGISFYPHDGHDIDTLFSQADTAMYRAKDQGKNTYMIYHSNMKERFFEKLTLENQIRTAIQNNQFELHYQPQIDLKTGNMVGAEALIRWNHPHLGMISPQDFIPLVEEMGLAVLMGEWVIETACKQLKSWLNKGVEPFRVSVNLSPQQFIKQNLVDTIERILTEVDLEPQFLEIEITESMTMDVERAIITLDKLNKLGVKIAIDDFGTGYSSLNYLKNFSIHRLKIDRTFVKDIMNNENDAKIVSTIISMAHGLKLEVLAEGVETQDQAAYLSRLNCNQAQGFYYSKPLPSVEIENRFLTKGQSL